ncbi:MAG: EamA family transporter [Candidatus Nanopelagicales bacterium]
MTALLAVMSSLMWGTADFVGGVTSRRLPALAVYGLSQGVGFVVLGAIATVSGGWSRDPGYWPWAIGASVLGLVAMVALYRALAIGPMGIVSPLVSVSVLVPVAVSLLRGEQPAPIQVLGIILAVVGILLASGPELSGAESARPLVLAGVAALGFGGMYVLMAEGSRHDAVMTMTGMRVTSVVIFAVVLIAVRSVGGAGRRDALPLVVIGIFDAGANVAFGVATTTGLLSTTSVLGSLYPVVTAILAAIFLRERLRAVQYAGVVAAIGGVLMIASAG